MCKQRGTQFFWLKTSGFSCNPSLQHPTFPFWCNKQPLKMPSYFIPSPHSMTHQIMPASSPVLSHRSRHHSLSSPMLSPILSPVHFAEPLPYVHGDTMGSYGYTSGYTAGPSYGYAVQQPHYPSGYSSPSRHQSYDDGYYSGSSRRSSSRRRRRSSSYVRC